MFTHVLPSCDSFVWMVGGLYTTLAVLHTHTWSM